MYLETIKSLYQSLSIYKPIPCTREEILLLEYDLKITIPDAYKEFLMWAGHDAGFLLRGSNYRISDIKEIQGWAVELLKENGLREILPPIRYVFLEHQGYTFLYFTTLTSNNPDVYQYEEGYLEGKNRGKFTEFLENELIYTSRSSIR